MANETNNEKAIVIKNLIAKGKAEGTLTYDEIINAVQNFDLDAGQMDAVYEQLFKVGIKIVSEAHDDEADLSDDETMEEIPLLEMVDEEDAPILELEEIENEAIKVEENILAD